MKRIFMAALLCIIMLAVSFAIASAATDAGYENAKGVCTPCSDAGQQRDTWDFFTCNCTSYASYRINNMFSEKIGSFGIYHGFENSYVFSAMNSEEKNLLASKISVMSAGEIDLNYLNPPDPYRWSNAGRWGHIARALGIPVYEEPREGTIAWWDAKSGMPVGHVAFVAEKKSVNGKTLVRLEEYNIEPLLFSDNRWVDTDSADKPDGYIDFVAYERDRIEINKRNHPELFQYDDYCRQWSPSSEVEVFRTSDGGFIKNRNLVGLPDNRIWYYNTALCTIALSPPMSDLLYINDRLIFADGLGGGSSGGGGTGNESLPNLQVRNITVWDTNGNQLTEKVSMLVPGQVVTVRKQIISLDEDASKGTDPDIQNIETDLYTMIALDESESSWAFYARSYTEVWRMVEDNILILF